MRKIMEFLAVSPKGWGGTVKKMKENKDISNAYALAWSMKNKGYTPHYPAIPEDEEK